MKTEKNFVPLYLSNTNDDTGNLVVKVQANLHTKLLSCSLYYKIDLHFLPKHYILNK